MITLQLTEKIYITFKEPEYLSNVVPEYDGTIRFDGINHSRTFMVFEEDAIQIMCRDLARLLRGEIDEFRVPMQDNVDFDFFLKSKNGKIYLNYFYDNTDYFEKSITYQTCIKVKDYPVQKKYVYEFVRNYRRI